MGHEGCSYKEGDDPRRNRREKEAQGATGREFGSGGSVWTSIDPITQQQNTVPQTNSNTTTLPNLSFPTTIFLSFKPKQLSENEKDEQRLKILQCSLRLPPHLSLTEPLNSP